MTGPAAQDRLPARLLMAVFAPFAAGNFLSYFFRNVNAVVSRDLTREFSLAPSDLGLLTAACFLAFACLAAGITTGVQAIVMVYGFCSISAALGFALLAPRFPAAM